MCDHVCAQSCPEAGVPSGRTYCRVFILIHRTDRKQDDRLELGPGAGPALTLASWPESVLDSGSAMALCRPHSASTLPSLNLGSQAEQTRVWDCLSRTPCQIRINWTPGPLPHPPAAAGRT